MRKLIISVIIPFIAAFAVSYFIYMGLIGTDIVKQEIKLEIVLDSYQESNLQFFLEDSVDFKPVNSQTIKLPAEVKDYKIEFKIPDLKKPGKLRIDPSVTKGLWTIKKITLKGFSKNIEFRGDSILKHFIPNSDIKQFEITATKAITLEASGNDAYIVSDFLLKNYLDVLEKKPIIDILSFCFSGCCFFLLLYFIRQKLLIYNDSPFTTSHLIIFYFCLIISMPFLWMNIFPIEQNEFTEKRILKPKPAFDFIHINQFFNLYTGYFEDNLGLKKPLSTLNSYYKYKLFNSSSKPDRVVIGKDSWLFSVEDGVAGDYQNLKSFTQKELQIIKQNLEEISMCYNKLNVKFYCIVLPVKSSIYPEQLPDIIKRKNQPSRLSQLTDFLKPYPTLNFIDVTKEFIKEKDSADVFYAHDIHINYLGGFLAYKKMIDKIKETDSRIEPMKIGYYYKLKIRIPNADLSNILSLDYKLFNDEYYLQKGVRKKFLKVEAPTYASIPMQQSPVKTIVKNANLPKVVVYRDSYFNLIMPYFSENFKECVYIWSYEMTKEPVEKEKPDVIVLEMTEATLDRLLNDNPKWIKDAAAIK
ncbi:MAG: hypothetical protein KAZ71_01670 [Bacteroidia bacterium]|nr:hypothetical protein [Bacteroidia bacterium]